MKYIDVPGKSFEEKVSYLRENGGKTGRSIQSKGCFLTLTDIAIRVNVAIFDDQEKAILEKGNEELAGCIRSCVIKMPDRWCPPDQL